jgi:hypothetical protein
VTYGAGAEDAAGMKDSAIEQSLIRVVQAVVEHGLSVTDVSEVKLANGRRHAYHW